MICRDDKYLQVVAHLYRGEMNRLTIYRQRLDTTTNWSITILLSSIVLYMGNDAISSHMIFFFIVPIVVFSIIEARRYRYYLISHHRIRLLEKYFYVQQIIRDDYTDGSICTELIDTLWSPSYTVSFFRAWNIRFSRNYIWLLYLIIMAWFIKCQMDQIIIFSAGCASIVCVHIILSWTDNDHDS